jgi:hypothetical protein
MENPMPQANSHSIITAGSRVLTPQAHEAVASRRLIGLDQFAKPAANTIVYPVPDDRWAPLFRCGEFAVADLNHRHLEEGAFVLWKGSRDVKIIRLKQHNTEKQGRLVGLPKDPQWKADPCGIGGGYWHGLCWWMQFGLSQMQFIDGTMAETYMSADGPLADQRMREQCLGRMVGVMGASGRSLSWQDGGAN